MKQGRKESQYKSMFVGWPSLQQLGSILLGPSEEPCSWHLQAVYKKVEGSIYSSAAVSHGLRVAPWDNFLVLSFCNCVSTGYIYIFRTQWSLSVESERSME